MTQSELKKYIQTEYYYTDKCIEQLKDNGNKSHEVLDFLIGKKDTLLDILSKIEE